MASRTWRQAVEQSETLLSGSEREVYGNSRPEDIVQDLRERQFDPEQTSKIQEFLSKIKPLLVAVEQVASIACTSPGILSPAWGTLRFLLLVGQRDFSIYL